MRRKSATHKLLSAHLHENLITRLKFAYSLQIALRDENRVVRVANPDVKWKTDNSFIFLAERLRKQSKDHDPEGVVQSGFDEFPGSRVYPNMLLSDRVIVRYERDLPVRLAHLNTIFQVHYATLTNRLAIYTPPNLTKEDILPLFESIHPIMTWWTIKKFRSSKEDFEDLFWNARLAFRLWPFGYMNHSGWKQLVIEGGLYDDTFTTHNFSDIRSPSQLDHPCDRGSVP